ncbi:helicase-related protein [Smaragdicoccus niigatensis]|uniref:helicase-related protein n=1 Tax=Smaragdicoccus niigatensis TaxID=359359 RepID=UPI0009DC096E|nr:helicase-related protein [Smaragdicoccus niigatensis]
MVEDLSSWYDARDQIVDDLEAELLGPAEPIPLAEPPLDRIIVGVLYPRRPDSASAEYLEGMENDAAGESDGAGANDESAETTVALSRSKKPSSMGLSFSVLAGVTQDVEVFVSARRYAKDESEDWRAVDVAFDTPHVLSMAKPGTVDVAVATNENLRLVGLVRTPVDGQVRVTLSLLNTNEDAPGHADSVCWFRPTLTVRAVGPGFVDRRRQRSGVASDPDVRSAEFLYRSVPSLAVGHGCAVEWDADVSPVTELRTTFLPTHEVRLANPAGGGESDPYGTYQLSMNAFAKHADVEQLEAMVAAYSKWIAARHVEAAALDPSVRGTALEHLALAEQCAARMRLGIDALADEEVALAFRLMNEAMVSQRDAQDRSRGTKPRPQEWRPFQLAFILMNLPGLASPDHADRDVVDLLWFPTGGGKTEAYLGCIGFSILFRRLRNPRDGGVSAIMRYTLRLLTRQQFERAAGLICALELIRRREVPDSAPVSLGLWVGNQATPNSVKDAAAILRKIASGGEVEGSTPVQLLRCPWCASKLSHSNYVVVADSELHIRCSSSFCEFREGLPCWVTDEDVYRAKPSLIIGTVDKFAMMAWRPEVGSLLSVDGPYSRPDLIVQDELHLISGPLGTIVGLYESALDLACTGAGRPKVLASTATIRRAADQVRNVFDRESIQFPPPGLDPSDNYFAVDATREEKGTRRYVAVMAPGTSQSTVLVRLYAALLQSAAELEATETIRDDYWTLLGYFNSLRVLGSTYLQVLDDVPDRIKVVAARHSTEGRAISQEPVELTSRVDQNRIPSAMAALETPYGKQGCPDVVLATNMISVGLDIDRLGLMVVAGQPQSTSEYIQSTSRVGRRHPGLVVVALNAQRSRDTSHYESFIPFHRALYREVEATTATPFASRARDRAAHGVLVSAARLLVPALRGDRSVVEVNKHRSEVEAAIARLVERAERVSPDEAGPFKEQLDALLQQWADNAIAGAIEEYGKLSHPSAKKSAGPSLMTQASGNSSPSTYPVSEPPWPTLTSMRDVDDETPLFEKYVAKEAISDGVEKDSQLEEATS